ncbi:MAG: efflux RND transporter periplasmic adaptor subunit [Acidobacteriota bacterium]
MKTRPCLLALLSASALLLPACSTEGRADRTSEAPPAPAVEAVAARTGSLPLRERLSGIAKAENQVEIYPEISASVAEVLVRSGEAVLQGQPLVRLADAEFREQLRQAEANVRLAEGAAAEARARIDELEAQVTRTRSLAEEELISRVELETQEARLAAALASAEQSDARVEQARASADQSRTALQRTVIRAPVSGNVGQRNAEVGMLADTNSLLFVLGNLDSLIVEVPLTDRMLGYVEAGQSVEISASALGEETIVSKLSRVSPFLQQGSFSTIGEIDVANPGALRPGMFATVDVLYGDSEEATLVPSSSLWENPGTGLVGVYVVEPPNGPQRTADTGGSETTSQNGGLEGPPWAVKFVPVEILATGRLTVGVSGIEPGDWVVTLGQNLLSDGDSAVARVRTTSWDKVLDLQNLQKEDLLRGFLEKQQRMARQYGAEPPGHQEALKAAQSSQRVSTASI